MWCDCLLSVVCGRTNDRLIPQVVALSDTARVRIICVEGSQAGIRRESSVRTNDCYARPTMRAFGSFLPQVKASLSESVASLPGFEIGPPTLHHTIPEGFQPLAPASRSAPGGSGSVCGFTTPKGSQNLRCDRSGVEGPLGIPNPGVRCATPGLTALNPPGSPRTGRILLIDRRETPGNDATESF
jgi:hypothetical protein